MANTIERTRTNKTDSPQQKEKPFKYGTLIPYIPKSVGIDDIVKTRPRNLAFKVSEIKV